MSSKERLLAVYRGERPDRVPVQPCFAYLLPMKRSGRPFNRFTGDHARITLDTYRCYVTDARVWLPVWGIVQMNCPFERPPGGDVTSLAAVRRRYGSRIGIMGNVHTIDVLLNGTPEDVRRQVRECIEEAAGGPFILSTGDQVSHLTPEANIRAFCDAGREFGRL